MLPVSGGSPDSRTGGPVKTGLSTRIFSGTDARYEKTLVTVPRETVESTIDLHRLINTEKKTKIRLLLRKWETTRTTFHCREP